MVGRSLEHHVLEQVGHARLTIALMARAHEDGQVDGDLGRDASGKSKTLKPLAR